MEDDLRQLLNELSAAIERTGESEHDRAELARLVAAVEQRLEAERSDTPPDEHRHLIEALKKAEIRFESDHPLLGRAIQQAIQALTAAGI